MQRVERDRRSWNERNEEWIEKGQKRSEACRRNEKKIEMEIDTVKRGEREGGKEMGCLVWVRGGKQRCGGWCEGNHRRVCRGEEEGVEEAEGRHSLSHRARAMSGARSLVFCLRYDATASPVTAASGGRGWFAEERDHVERVGSG